jgi:hypothetical protein
MLSVAVVSKDQWTPQIGEIVWYGSAPARIIEPGMGSNYDWAIAFLEAPSEERWVRSNEIEPMSPLEQLAAQGE